MMADQRTVLVTGGRGFVGSHLVEHLLKNTDWRIVVFDKLGYASMAIKDISVWAEAQERVQFYAIDLNLSVPTRIAEEIGEVDTIYHLAAESHVYRSIEEPVPFVKNNVAATLHIMEFARVLGPKLVINFSTDEVFGPAPEGRSFSEFEYHNPSNPYAASKSAQEAIGIAYSRTYGVPVVTTHTMNIFGERQHPEKFVPLCIHAALSGDLLSIHGTKDGKSGSRMWLHARNVADALLFLTRRGYQGYDEWNVCGHWELSNLELALMIADIVGKPLNHELVDAETSRPGHDPRYSLDPSKLAATGYQYPADLETSMTKCVNWSVERGWYR